VEVVVAMVDRMGGGDGRSDGWSGVRNAVSTRTAAQNRHRLSQADKFSVTDVAVAVYPVGRYDSRFVGNAIDQ